jgi:stearoyl-CoA desaturase (delta-9 desaturase)
MHWFISYFAHSRGPQDWTLDGAALQAYNVPIMAIPTMGESWHNNHHAFPSSARHGLYPGQVDLGWYFILLLERLGLAWNIKQPRSCRRGPGSPRPRSERSPSPRLARSGCEQEHRGQILPVRNAWGGGPCEAVVEG